MGSEGESSQTLSPHPAVFNPFFAGRKGKTTLLKHIANRALSIPPNIDVLLCEQGALRALRVGSPGSLGPPKTPDFPPKPLRLPPKTPSLSPRGGGR